MAAAHGETLSRLVPELLPQLCANQYVTIKAISQSSHQAALALLEAAPSGEAVSRLLSLAKDPHDQQRRAVAALRPLAVAEIGRAHV